MKRTTKIFVAIALLLAGTVFAQSNPEEITLIGYKCEGGNKNNSLECSIAQYGNITRFIKAGYAQENIYKTWSDLVDGLKSDPLTAMGYTYLHLTFETDIDLGDGYLESEKRCYGNGFNPINYHQDFATVVIEGKNVPDNGPITISDYCDVTLDGEYPSFFRKIRTNVTIKNLTFDNAYVMSKLTGKSNSRPYSAVVVDEVRNGKATFENVSVTNSKVYGWSPAAVVGNVDGEVHFSGVTVKDVTLSSNEGVFKEHDNFPAAFSASHQTAYSGGLVARFDGYLEADDVTIENLKIEDAIEQLIKGAGGVYEGRHIVGGVAGLVNASLAVNQNISLQNCHVSGTLNGSEVGGLIGYVGQLSVEEYPEFLVKNTDVTIAVGDYSGKSQWARNLGGLVGEFSWKGKIDLSNNSVDVTVKNTNVDACTDQTSIGGLVGYTEAGYFEDVAGNDYPAEVSVADNNVVAEIVTPEKTLNVGGALGYVKVKSFSSAKGVLSIKGTSVTANITSSSKDLTYIMAAYGVGYAENGDGSISYEKNAAKGNISVAATSFASRSFVGTAFGDVYNSGTLIVRNNSSKGNLFTPENGAMGNKFIVGYEIGYAMVKSITLLDNFHYGTEDANVVLALGALEVGAGIPPSYWRTQQGSGVDVRYNYRNAIGKGSNKLAADGEFAWDGSGKIYVEQQMYPWYNGVIGADVMKTRLFTYVLNKTQPNDKTASYWDNEPDELPKFSTTRTAFQLEIDVDAMDYEALTTDDKDLLNGYLYVDKSTDPESYYVYAYTEKNSRLNDEFIDRIENTSLLVTTTVASQKYDFSQDFVSDVRVWALANRELTVVYEMIDPAAAANVELIPMDTYSEKFFYVWPKIEKVHLLSDQQTVPVAKVKIGEIPYELDLSYAYVENTNGGVTKVYSGTNLVIENFEKVLKGVKEHSGVMKDNKVHLVYYLVDMTTGTSYLPETDVGVIKSDARVSVTTYVYNALGKITEHLNLDFAPTASLSTQTGLFMSSKYGFSLNDRGYDVDGWDVQFWIAPGETSTDVLKLCVPKNSSVPAKCAENLHYEDLSENYFGSEYKIEKAIDANVNNSQNSTPKFMKWSTTLKPDEKLNLDSVIQALSVVMPTTAYKLPTYLAVEPQLTAIPYKISFDVNAGDREVFLADKFVSAKNSYSRENAETARLPEGLLSTSACFIGWDKKTEGQVSLLGAQYYFSLDGNLLASANPNDDESFDLYGNWIPAGESFGNLNCKSSNIPMMLSEVDKFGAKGNYGKVTLWQSYQKLGKETEKFEHPFENGSVEIPAYDDMMTLHVSVEPEDGYKLARMWLVSTETGKTPDEDPITLYHDKDTLFTIIPSGYDEYELVAQFGHYLDVPTDLNGDHGPVYGTDFDVQSIEVVDGGSVDLPLWIYSTKSCVYGWSQNANAKWNDNGVYRERVSEQEDLYSKLGKSKLLYAVWADADVCVEKADYNHVSLVAEHGSVELEEISQNGNSSSMHAFAEDGSMIMPGANQNANFVLRAKPEMGYKLDSFVVVYNDKVNGNELSRYVLSDGAVMPVLMGNATVMAYFSRKKVDFKLVDRGLRQRGNAVGVYFAMDKSRSDSVEIKVTLMDALDKDLDNSMLKVDSVGYKPFFALVPGKYSVRASLAALDSVILDTNFTVESEIKVEKDSWKLLALSDVDQSDIDWNGDQLFYRWDESASFGNYWKYQKYQGKNANATLGYWYNSLEGRALPLRRDVATDGHEIVWTLDSGWNMMANPYGWDVTLRHESISEDINDSLVVWSWLGEISNYGVNIRLDPYEAVMVYSNKKRTLTIKAEDYFETFLSLNDGQGKALPKARGNRALAKASARDNWALQAVLADAAGHRDSWNVLGVGTVAETFEPPEGMGDHVSLSVVSGEKALAKSVVAPKSGADGYSWQVALSASSDRVGYLKFDGLADLAGLGYRVYVTYEGETREVPPGDSLSVMLKAKGATATVQVTTSEIRTIASKVENLRFERVPGALQVGFDVSSDLAGTPYKVQLVGLNGQVAATYSAKALSGRNTLALNAPKNGLYVLRVTVGGQHAVRKAVIR